MAQHLEIINDWTLKKFMAELETGHIKIPKFQRDFIWEKNKVVKLLNSVYHQYPIGSFFLWDAPSEYTGFIRENLELGIGQTESNGTFQFILDGQQRMISLFVSMHGKTMDGVDYASICFNPIKKEFIIPRGRTDRFNIPAWKLFSETDYSSIYNELMADDKQYPKRINLLSEAWKHCREVFNNYPISIVKARHSHIDDVVEIFERINQGGKHLTVFDLIHATTWSDEFDLKSRIEEYNRPEFIKKHGALSNKVFTFSLTLNAFDDARNLYQLKLTPLLCQNIWPKTTRSLNHAIEFLKQMRISGNIIAYHNTLPILQYYFFKSGFSSIQSQHQKEIEKWFWDAKFSKRYASSVTTRLKEDVAWINRLLGK